MSQIPSPESLNPRDVPPIDRGAFVSSADLMRAAADMPLGMVDRIVDAVMASPDFTRIQDAVWGGED